MMFIILDSEHYACMEQLAECGGGLGRELEEGAGGAWARGDGSLGCRRDQARLHVLIAYSSVSYSIIWVSLFFQPPFAFQDFEKSLIKRWTREIEEKSSQPAIQV